MVIETNHAASYALVFPLALLLLWQSGSCRDEKSSTSASSESKAVAVTANQNENLDVVAQGNGEANPASSPDDQNRGTAEGVWGGANIRVEVSDDGGAEVEYACAHGRIEKIVLDTQGNFTAGGSHLRERGGPIRVGQESSGQPARYSGRIKGETMTLEVTLAESGESLGTFTLTRGKKVRIMKCLEAR